MLNVIIIILSAIMPSIIILNAIVQGIAFYNVA
jgi:hypothetical protein